MSNKFILKKISHIIQTNNFNRKEISNCYKLKNQSLETIIINQICHRISLNKTQNNFLLIKIIADKSIFYLKNSIKRSQYK
jgi:hypothetical protein